MSYQFKFKRRMFWKSIKVTGHRYDEMQDKMVLYFENGGVREIAHWKDCECQLNIDWVLEMKKQMERESGTDVKLRV